MLMRKNYSYLILFFIFTTHFILSQTTETETFTGGSNTLDDSSDASPVTGFWNGVDDDDYPGMTYRTGSTASSSTGPTAGYGGSGVYIYSEASSNEDETYAIESDVFNGTVSHFSFYYHMYGTNIPNGALVVKSSTNSGTSWTTLLTLNTDQGNS